MFAYLIILFLSPLILLLLLTVPQYIWSLFEKPKLDAKVNQLYAKNPEITFIQKYLDSKITTEILVKNYRNTRYLNSEWNNNIVWENKKYKLEELESLEALIDHYGFLQSHIILIANFVDHLGITKKLCFSYEPKKKDPKQFNVIEAIYKNFEAGYIVGSLEDLVGVRFLRYENFNHEKAVVNLGKAQNSVSGFKNPIFYKLNFTQNESQEIFKSLAADINIYSKSAFFYNFIYRNCLSEILKHFRVTGHFNFSSAGLLFVKRLLEKIRKI